MLKIYLGVPVIYVWASKQFFSVVLQKYCQRIIRSGESLRIMPEKVFWNISEHVLNTSVPDYYLEFRFINTEKFHVILRIGQYCVVFMFVCIVFLWIQITFTSFLTLDARCVNNHQISK